MVCTIFAKVGYPALMLLIGAISLAVNIYIVRKSNEKLKKEQMDKKLDKTDFTQYKTDHNLMHVRDREDLKEIKEMVKFLYEIAIKR
jgi:hypothetical protein